MVRSSPDADSRLAIVVPAPIDGVRHHVGKAGGGMGLKFRGSGVRGLEQRGEGLLRAGNRLVDPGDRLARLIAEPLEPADDGGDGGSGVASDDGEWVCGGHGSFPSCEDGRGFALVSVGGAGGFDAPNS